jgi:glycosyltransferase involved in cell wall biosynthesis
VTTLLEAMAMGKAVVVTATAGLRDLFDDGLSALAVPPGDADAMREAVASLLASPRERARLGANARAAAEARFGLERYAAGLAAELQAVTRGGRHRLALTGKAGDAMRPSPLP